MYKMHVQILSSIIYTMYRVATGCKQMSHSDRSVTHSGRIESHCTMHNLIYIFMLYADDTYFIPHNLQISGKSIIL